jgi:inhibitor of KinA
VPKPLSSVQIVPLGDSALLVRLSDNFADRDETISAVRAAQRRLEAAQFPGVIEIAPAYTTVAVFYRPIHAIDAGAAVEDVLGWLEQRIRAALTSVGAKHHRARRTGSAAASRTIEIPVCYDPEFAPDLEHMARNAGVSRREVVDLHSSAEYCVSCIGFTPGFPYLSGLPPRLATPRRPTPRREIPAGSVGIGGTQTGIYPIKSPGGWNVIGRTPLRLFDPEKNPPALLRAGDRVRFRPITREEFARLEDGLPSPSAMPNTRAGGALNS